MNIEIHGAEHSMTSTHSNQEGVAIQMNSEAGDVTVYTLVQQYIEGSGSRAGRRDPNVQNVTVCISPEGVVSVHVPATRRDDDVRMPEVTWTSADPTNVEVN
jgi:hypothetical protein